MGGIWPRYFWGGMIIPPAKVSGLSQTFF